MPQPTGEYLPPVHRSPVPDLLFEDVRTVRIRDIYPYLLYPERIGALDLIHRVTVFLTYRCNLECHYCKSIIRSRSDLMQFPHRAASFTVEMFDGLLQSFAGASVSHLHFTGGEAALIGDLPEMVGRAKDWGVSYTSITSNGTMPFRVYKSLIESGLDEIRISIDADDPRMSAVLTGNSHAWSRTIRTIKLLADFKARNPKFFLIGNTVVTKRNRLHVGRIANFLISLGLSDLKLIAAAQEKNDLNNFPEVGDVVRELETIIQKYPTGKFDLFRRKVQTVFDPSAIGLEDVQPRKNWRCYLALTERTVDSVYYYPCSVYLREGGRAIGTIDEPADLRRQKIADFVNNGNCLSDPICRKYCLYCTKNFNMAANELSKEYA
jgi:molybdenum cofactor biosynthesis enzyme MoaA